MRWDLDTERRRKEQQPRMRYVGGDDRAHEEAAVMRLYKNKPSCKTLAAYVRVRRHLEPVVPQIKRVVNPF